MKQYINRRHISLVLALFVLYLAITYWEIVAKFIQTIFSATVPLLIGAILAYIVNLLLNQETKCAKIQATGWNSDVLLNNHPNNRRRFCPSNSRAYYVCKTAYCKS